MKRILRLIVLAAGVSAGVVGCDSDGSPEATWSPMPQQVVWFDSPNLGAAQGGITQTTVATDSIWLDGGVQFAGASVTVRNLTTGYEGQALTDTVYRNIYFEYALIGTYPYYYWSLGNMPLVLGDNIITVTATAASGWSGSMTLTVHRTIYTSVSIDFPPPAGEWTTNLALLPLTGKAAALAVAAVDWENTTSGSSGACTGTDSARSDRFADSRTS